MGFRSTGARWPGFENLVVEIHILNIKRDVLLPPPQWNRLGKFQLAVITGRVIFP